MLFFKRRPKEVKPICIHDWYLIDAELVEEYNGIDIDFYKFYKVGCIKCNHTKSLNELEFSHFKRTFEVEHSLKD